MPVVQQSTLAGDAVDDPLADEVVDVLDIPQVATARIELTFERDLEGEVLAETRKRRKPAESIARRVSQLIVVHVVDGEADFARQSEHGPIVRARCRDGRARPRGSTRP